MRRRATPVAVTTDTGRDAGLMTLVHVPMIDAGVRGASDRGVMHDHQFFEREWEAIVARLEASDPQTAEPLSRTMRFLARASCLTALSSSFPTGLAPRC
jgi:hypothetical protein